MKKDVVWCIVIIAIICVMHEVMTRIIEMNEAPKIVHEYVGSVHVSDCRVYSNGCVLDKITYSGNNKYQLYKYDVKYSIYRGWITSGYSLVDIPSGNVLERVIVVNDGFGLPIIETKYCGSLVDPYYVKKYEYSKYGVTIVTER